MKTTLRLWSYLQSMRGRIVEINPVVDMDFDPETCKRHDEEDEEVKSSISRRAKVAWIVCRGVRYYAIDGTLVTTQKAVVLVEDLPDPN